MDDIAWEICESVETEANPEFAWAYMSNVANWDDPPATFELDGPFASGSWGVTRTPGQEPRRWQLASVCPPESYVVEVLLDGAAVRCAWSFGDAGSGTKLTQRLTLSGENAATFLEPVREAFTAGLRPGMARIAAAIDRAVEASR